MITPSFTSFLFGRKNIKVLADERESIAIKELKAENLKDKYDVIINLAYPDSYSRKRNFETNRDIVKTIKALSHLDTTIIHTSTLVIFGNALDRPIRKEPVTFRRDHHYAEVKVHMENLLLKEFPINPLHIVRLGNVWGPCAANTLHTIANRLIYQEPIPGAAQTAFSNLTDVYNVCDFIAYLAGKAHKSGRQCIHHFAEFSEIKWGKIISELAARLGDEPVYKPFRIETYDSVWKETAQLLSPVSPRAVFNRMLEKRVLSSFAKSLVDILPPKYRQAGKVFSADYIYSRNVTDQMFSNQVQFVHMADKDWQPPLSFEESMKKAIHSLKEAGYLLKE